MSKGEVIETGSHAELIRKDTGMYKDLCAAQELKAFEEGISAKAASPSTDKVAVWPGESAVDMNFSGEKKVEGESSPTLSGKTAVEDAKKKTSIPFARLFKMTRPEAGFLVIGGFAAALNGAIMPVFAIVFSEILSVFGETDFDILRERANLFALYFVALAVGAFFINFAQISSFGLSGERMTKSL
jgi:hypothetical protein